MAYAERDHRRLDDPLAVNVFANAAQNICRFHDTRPHRGSGTITTRITGSAKCRQR